MFEITPAFADGLQVGFLFAIFCVLVAIYGRMR